MNTLSIAQAFEQFQKTVHSFEGITAYKVEFGMWDHSTKPYVQLYVTGTLNGQFYFKHAESPCFYEAFKEIKEWYRQISQLELVIETDKISA
jgi:hypothetical protein